MATPAGPNTPSGRSRAFSSSHTAASTIIRRPGSERDLRNGSSSTAPELRSPATLPKAFESMLKTTTETGDIGMFSIKPSRVPSSLHSPRRTSYNDQGLQRPHRSFQQYGGPVMDDRRRLPSYARDTTSELISMYETPSQKSSRVFDDSDYRSFSMTQASSYTLSNHRSYTSLRSQPEGNGLLQRPRSPFAYPTRLKRPGFRPSSPALTDGGAVDYRRRAEIDRMTYVGVQGFCFYVFTLPNAVIWLSAVAKAWKPPCLLLEADHRSVGRPHDIFAVISIRSKANPSSLVASP